MNEQACIGIDSISSRWVYVVHGGGGGGGRVSVCKGYSTYIKDSFDSCSVPFPMCKTWCFYLAGLLDGNAPNTKTREGVL